MNNPTTEEIVANLRPTPQQARWLAQDEDGQWWYYRDVEIKFADSNISGGYRWYGGMCGLAVSGPPVTREIASGSCIDIQSLRNNDEKRA